MIYDNMTDNEKIICSDIISVLSGFPKGVYLLYSSDNYGHKSGLGFLFFS